jgi:hypothetical protein
VQSFISQFYIDVRQTEARITREILNNQHPHQPPPVTMRNIDSDEIEQRVEAVYLVSLHNRSRFTTSGSVAGAPLRLAAERIVEGTHALANAEQVRAWRQHQADQLSLRHASDAKKANRFEIKLPTEAAKD